MVRSILFEAGLMTISSLKLDFIKKTVPRRDSLSFNNYPKFINTPDSAPQPFPR
jgi:hypothetical protein